MKTVLDERERTLTTPRGTWTVEAKHNRPGGDVDVILAFRTGPDRPYLFAFRRSEGEWTQISGSWRKLPAAVREAAGRTNTQVFTAQYLVALLRVAARLADFPDFATTTGDDEKRNA